MTTNEHSIEDHRADLETLRDQFRNAAAEFPCLTHVWLRWPEEAAEPSHAEFPVDLRPMLDPGGIEDDGSLWSVAMFPRRGDTKGARYLPSFASEWWLRRDYGSFEKSSSVRNVDEQTACLERLKPLMSYGALVLQGVGLDLPDGILKSTYDTCWLLGLQCLLEGRHTKPVIGYDIGAIQDVFLSSALLCGRLLNGPLLPPAAPTGAKPAWDKETGKLWLNGAVVKIIKNSKQATRVIRVLDEFQELNWPERMDDPLPRNAEGHLRYAIASLNHNLDGMYFKGDGKGGIAWDLRAP